MKGYEIMATQKKGAKKRERLGNELSTLKQRIAELKEIERNKKKEFKENESLCIVEIVKDYNITTDELTMLLSNNAQLRDTAANAQGGVIPVQTTQAVIGTVPQKTKTEKEKNHDEEEID
jgi:hypothetical protein